MMLLGGWADLRFEQGLVGDGWDRVRWAVVLTGRVAA
jgi:hypothetical protein